MYVRASDVGAYRMGVMVLLLLYGKTDNTDFKIDD